jgi:hypothetical protein
VRDVPPLGAFWPADAVTAGPAGARTQLARRAGAVGRLIAAADVWLRQDRPLLGPNNQGPGGGLAASRATASSALLTRRCAAAQVVARLRWRTYPLTLSCRGTDLPGLRCDGAPATVLQQHVAAARGYDA